MGLTCAGRCTKLFPEPYVCLLTRESRVPDHEIRERRDRATPKTGEQRTEGAKLKRGHLADCRPFGHDRSRGSVTQLGCIPQDRCGVLNHLPDNISSWFDSMNEAHRLPSQEVH